ncbi:MAG: hypothetical protein IJR16_07585 [Spirochaetales bacterium]|nr:hypothetical protein [Spirochaetales bacterium]
MTYDERIAIEMNKAREMNLTKCISCKNCDLAVTSGTTAVVSCTRRGPILMNCKVCYCRFYEAMEVPRTEDPIEKELKKEKKSKEESNG